MSCPCTVICDFCGKFVREEDPGACQDSIAVMNCPFDHLGMDGELTPDPELAPDDPGAWA